MVGLVLHDIFVATTSVSYASIFPSVGLGVAKTIMKWGIASLLALPQSILLGMTYLLMTASVVRRIPQAGAARCRCCTSRTASARLAAVCARI